MKYGKIIDNGQVLCERIIIVETVTELDNLHRKVSFPAYSMAYKDQLEIINQGQKIAVNEMGGYFPIPKTSEVIIID